jgi:hypothetical protein
MRPTNLYLFGGLLLNRFTKRCMVSYNSGECVVAIDVLFYGFNLSRLSAI